MVTLQGAQWTIIKSSFSYKTLNYRLSPDSHHEANVVIVHANFDHGDVNVEIVYHVYMHLLRKLFKILVGFH